MVPVGWNGARQCWSDGVCVLICCVFLLRSRFPFGGHGWSLCFLAACILGFVLGIMRSFRGICHNGRLKRRVTGEVLQGWLWACNASESRKAAYYLHRSLPILKLKCHVGHVQCVCERTNTLGSMNAESNLSHSVNISRSFPISKRFVQFLRLCQYLSRLKNGINTATSLLPRRYFCILAHPSLSYGYILFLKYEDISNIHGVLYAASNAAKNS